MKPPALTTIDENEDCLAFQRNKYERIGQMGGVVVHDLSASLNVINLISSRLKRNKSFIDDPKYVNNLVDSVKNCLRLVDSLRAFIEDKNVEENHTVLGDAFEHVARILEIQYDVLGLPKFQLHLDPQLEGVSVQIKRNLLIHIIFNLASNSIENFQQHDIEDGRFSIEMDQQAESEPDAKKICLLLVDNGSGLSQSQFTEYTADNKAGENNKMLGLRLIKRLVSEAGGSLSLISQQEETGEGRGGTKFRLELNLHGGENG